MLYATEKSVNSLSMVNSPILLAEQMAELPTIPVTDDADRQCNTRACSIFSTVKDDASIKCTSLSEIDTSSRDSILTSGSEEITSLLLKKRANSVEDGQLTPLAGTIACLDIDKANGWKRVRRFNQMDGEGVSKQTVCNDELLQNDISSEGFGAAGIRDNETLTQNHFLIYIKQEGNGLACTSGVTSQNVCVTSPNLGSSSFEIVPQIKVEGWARHEMSNSFSHDSEHQKSNTAGMELNNVEFDDHNSSEKPCISENLCSDWSKDNYFMQVKGDLNHSNCEPSMDGVDVYQRLCVIANMNVLPSDSHEKEIFSEGPSFLPFDSKDFRSLPHSPITGVVLDCKLSDMSNMKSTHVDPSKLEANFSFPVACNSFKECSSTSEACVSSSGIFLGNIAQAQRLLALSHTVIDDYSQKIENEDKNTDTAIISPHGTIPITAKKMLLVLDVNGLLADIVLEIPNTNREVKRVGGKNVFARPFYDNFLQFCFERFNVGIWSSRRKYNLDSVIDYVFGDRKDKLLFCWDQDHCTNTGFMTIENAYKPLLLKELKKIWNRESRYLQFENGEYGSCNTLLVDDSPYKALCNPLYTAIFPLPYNYKMEHDNSLGPGGELRVYLEELSKSDDVQCYVREHPFGQPAITPTHPEWEFYSLVKDTVEKSRASYSQSIVGS